MKIGVFDSGIGGISVLAQAVRKIPFGEFLYYADTDHVPYGEKTEEEVMRYSEEALLYLMGQGVKAVVIACNTATSVAVAKLREKYRLPIIGMEPAVKRAVDLCREGRILVAATPVTLKGEKLHTLIGRVDSECKVDLLPLPGLVRMAEKGVFDSPEAEAYLREALSPYDLSRYGSMVLGCTHFIFFRETLEKILPSGVCLVDGNEGTVNQLIRRIKAECEEDDAAPSVTFSVSGRKPDRETEERFRSYLARL